MPRHQTYRALYAILVVGFLTVSLALLSVGCNGTAYA